MLQGLCRKVYVAWKHLMLHDVIGGHQAPIDRKKDGIGSRAAHDIINMNI